MNEREQLEQAIAALERQRTVLGDAVVDASLAALREKLAALTAAPRDVQRKLVTVLFADLAGRTRANVMAEKGVLCYGEHHDPTRPLASNVAVRRADRR